jgi:hypothetical protein
VCHVEPGRRLKRSLAKSELEFTTRKHNMAIALFNHRP